MLDLFRIILRFVSILVIVININIIKTDTSFFINFLEILVSIIYFLIILIVFDLT